MSLLERCPLGRGRIKDIHNICCQIILSLLKRFLWWECPLREGPLYVGSDRQQQGADLHTIVHTLHRACKLWQNKDTSTHSMHTSGWVAKWNVYVTQGTPLVTVQWKTVLKTAWKHFGHNGWMIGISDSQLQDDGLEFLDTMTPGSWMTVLGALVYPFTRYNWVRADRLRSWQLYCVGGCMLPIGMWQVFEV